VDAYDILYVVLTFVHREKENIYYSQNNRTEIEHKQTLTNKHI